MSAAPADRLETISCNRCGGSGRYSFNQIHGSRCYGCQGTGKVYTKRGAEAHRYLEALRSKRADAFMVGELVRHDIVTPYASARVWATVQSVTPVMAKRVINGVECTVPMVTLELAHKGEVTHYTVGVDTMMRKGFDAATKQQQLRDAIAYQATLTVKGKPMKIAA